MINIMINVHCLRLKNPQCFRNWNCLYVLMVENRGRTYSQEISKMLHLQRKFFFFTWQNGQCQKCKHTPKQNGFMWGQLSHAVYHSIKFHLSGYYSSSLTIKHKIDHHNAISQSTKISINNHPIALKEAYHHTECHFTECSSTSAPSVFHTATLLTNFTSHVILTEYACAPAGTVLNSFAANIIICKVKYSHKLPYCHIIQGRSLNMGCPLMAQPSRKSVNHIHSRTDAHTMAHRKTLWHNTVTFHMWH